MKNLWDLLKKDWRSLTVAFVVVNILCGLSFILYFFLAVPRNLYGATNGLLISFAIIFAILAFYILNRFGTFDMLGYGTSYLFGMFRIHPKKKYHDLIEYRDIKEEHRHKSSFYIPYSLALILWGVALFVVYIIYKASL